jgi:hypothetical protein
MKSKKATTSTAKPKTGKEDSTKAMNNAVTPDERQRMIAEAAYFHAEHRAFQGDCPEQDWFEAEVEINNLLAP